MDNVIGKYIKDENGNMISPITSTDTVYNYKNMVMSDCVPLVYNVNNNEQDKVINIMYNANITNWRMLRVTGCIRRDIQSR